MMTLKTMRIIKMYTIPRSRVGADYLKLYTSVSQRDLSFGLSIQDKM